MKLTISNVADQIKAAIVGIAQPIAQAATAAVKDAGAQMKTEGRANIGAAGFSTRWQNAWRVAIYPKSGTSIEPVAYGRHNIDYSGIFETGGTISGGEGLLWIPLSNVPRIGKSKATPKLLSQQGVKLFTMKGTNPPLLATSVAVTKSQAGRAARPLIGRTISLASLRTGSRAKGAERTTIPLFFGEKTVTLKKRFALDTVAQNAQNSIAARYAAYVPEFTGS